MYDAPVAVVARTSTRNLPRVRVFSSGPSPGSGSTRSSSARVGPNLIPSIVAASPPVTANAATGPVTAPWNAITSR